jgi:hypothetical protein
VFMLLLLLLLLLLHSNALLWLQCPMLRVRRSCCREVRPPGSRY